MFTSLYFCIRSVTNKQIFYIFSYRVLKFSIVKEKKTEWEPKLIYWNGLNTVLVCRNGLIFFLIFLQNVYKEKGKENKNENLRKS